MAISLYHSGHKQMLLSSVLGTKYSLGQVCVGCADCFKTRERLRVRGVCSESEHLGLSHGTHKFHQKLTRVTLANVTPKHITTYVTSKATLCVGGGDFSDFYLIKCCKWKWYI